MKIDNENLKKLSDDLKKKWKGRTCPLCQTGNWVIQDSCFEMREFNNGNFVLGGTVIPVIPITCSYCFNTIFINAILSELVSVNKEIKND